MSRLVVLFLGPAALCAAIALAQDAPKPAAETDAVRDALKAYGTAFNKNDAKAVAALWSPQGVYLDHETGERTVGRDAIQADLTELFKDHAGARISSDVDNIRLLTSTVAVANGRTTVSYAGSDPEISAFSAILTKQGEKWLLENVEESPVPTPESARAALKELGWMVGHWTDSSEAGRIDTTVRWGTGESFLVRSFVATSPEGEIQQGTQVIGWDPRAQQIRSWSFFSDGSFGEGTWAKSGNEWIINSQQTLEDGRLATGTNVIKIIDENTVMVSMVGRDIEGEPAPASEPVKVVRTPDPTATSLNGASTTPAAAPASAGPATPAVPPKAVAPPKPVSANPATKPATPVKR